MARNGLRLASLGGGFAHTTQDGVAARPALRFRSARSVPCLGSASAGLAALAAAAQAAYPEVA